MNIVSAACALSLGALATAPAFAQSEEVKAEMRWIEARCIISDLSDEESAGLGRMLMREQTPDKSAIEDAVDRAHGLCDEDLGWTSEQHDLADRITGAYAVKRLAEQRLASAGFKDLDALERKMGELPAIDRPKILTSAMRTDPALAARVQSLIEAAGVTKDQVKHAINRLEAQVMLEQFRPQWLALKPS